MSFEKHSNFNKLANFSEVKFGENMPVLEVELNEMQQIQNEARADIIRDTMPSGFVTLGDIDYDYCANNDNQIKLKTESIAYVNGYRITIPKDTIIEIGESDKEREDLVFLEVWKEAVNDIDTLTEYGGENNAVINNPIKDERYPVATSQRVALKYRIRHVGDVDFSEDTSGLSSLSYDFHSSDMGLYIKTFSESLDGIVYAIPMFRLLRKPHVGLASPFEYKKIHNQLDPKKFAHLVGQENVEKVHSVNIKGKTFKNLITHAKQQGNGALNVNVSPDIVTFDTNASWGKIGFLVKGEPNTKYIFHCSDFYREEKSIEFYVRFSDSIHATTQTLNKIDSNTYTFTTDSSGVFMFSFEISGGVSKAYVKYPILMKYSEWEEQLRGKKIAGVKSLGELENNSITVENNLIEEGTYVHELQNHILPTHPEVTHVTWGEDVVIPPEVEIELKRGEEVIQTITQLPVKLETTGEEKLHVKSMKGRTLVNLLNPNESVNTVTVSGGSQSWITVGSLISTLDVSKKYLVKLNVKQNTVDNLYGVYLLLRQLGVQGNTQYVPVASVVENGYVIITPDSDKTQIDSISIYAKDSVTSGSLVFDSFTIIEYQEGMENWVNKSFSGMKSVEAPSIKVTGKNIFDNVFTIGSWWNGVHDINPAHMRSVNLTPVKPNTTYFYNSTLSGHRQKANFMAHDINGNFIEYLGFCQTFTTPPNCHYIHLYTENDSTLYAQIEEGTISTPIEPYTSTSLKTPKGTVLRSLNPSLFDSIDFKTGELTSKIGETTITGKNSENNYIDNSSLTEHTRYRFQKSNLNLKYSSVENQYFKSNVLPCITTAWNQESEGFQADMSSPKWLWIRVKNSRLSSTDIPGVTAWLDNNPVTVQYEFSSPITKKIGLSEDDYVGKSKVTYQLAEPLRKVGTYSDFIKGNTLYSNIGVEVLNGSENIAQRGETLENTLLFVTHLTDLGIKSNLIYSDKFDGTDISWNEIITSDKEFIRLYTNDTNALYIRILKSKLATQDVNGFKKWLQDNPVTIYYVKANPMEIPLKEVSPLECDFSLNRQFKRGYENCLKELPNGVKDVIDKGKVSRNVLSLTLKGSETWTILSTDKDTLRAYTSLTNAKPISGILNSLNLPAGTSSQVREEMGIDQNGNLVISIFKTKLTSHDSNGVKNYLSANPIHCLIELKTPTTEELTEENCRYVPYMPLNSYVGSLYVADGINQTKFLTAFSPSEYEVQTYHRYFSNEFNIFEDIKRKKSPYGHKTYLEEVEGKYVEKFTAGLEKHEIEDLRHKVSLTGFDYNHLLQDSFLKLIKGELS